MKKRDSLEIQAGADTLLFPGNGGIALWVRRDEFLPRLAVRFRKDDVPLEETCCLLAAMEIGLAMGKEAMARKHGVNVEIFERMCAKAREFVEPHVKSEVEERTGKDVIG